jgi:SPP1 gp7 family putative phage head morphogenesis protein
MTRGVIKARADRLRIETNRKRGKLEGKCENAIRHIAGDFKGRCDAILKDAFPDGLTITGAYTAAAQFHGLREPLGEALVAVVEPAMREAAAIGAASIQATVDGKGLDYEVRRKAVSFTPETRDAVERRLKYMRERVPEAKINDILKAVMDLIEPAIAAGESVGYIQAAVRDVWTQMGNSQAGTIARTETGTLYCTARNEEMKAQGFEAHEWVASIDEMTRESHEESDGQVRRIGEQFPCGLEYPMEIGGPPGEVINCRCETIPAMEE